MLWTRSKDSPISNLRIYDRALSDQEMAFESYDTRINPRDVGFLFAGFLFGLGLGVLLTIVIMALMWPLPF